MRYSGRRNSAAPMVWSDNGTNGFHADAASDAICHLVSSLFVPLVLGSDPWCHVSNFVARFIFLECLWPWPKHCTHHTPTRVEHFTVHNCIYPWMLRCSVLFSLALTEQVGFFLEPVRGIVKFIYFSQYLAHCFYFDPREPGNTGPLSPPCFSIWRQCQTCIGRWNLYDGDAMRCQRGIYCFDSIVLPHATLLRHDIKFRLILDRMAPFVSGSKASNKRSIAL